MPPKPRNPAPQGRNTRATGKTAYKPPQRRLRQIVSEVDWVDVALGAVAGQCLDAMGGWVDITGHVNHALDMLFGM